MRDNVEKLDEDIKRNGIREKNNTNWKWVKAIRIKDWRFKTKQKGINTKLNKKMAVSQPVVLILGVSGNLNCHIRYVIFKIDLCFPQASFYKRITKQKRKKQTIQTVLFYFQFRNEALENVCSRFYARLPKRSFSNVDWDIQSRRLAFCMKSERKYWIFRRGLIKNLSWLLQI